MNINAEDETTYTSQYPEAILKWQENEYCAKPEHLCVTKSESIASNNLFSYAIPSRSRQSCSDQQHLFSADNEYLMAKNGAKMTLGRSNHTAHLLTAARSIQTSLPELPQNWGQINLNPNDYHSNRIQLSHTCWQSAISDCSTHQAATHSKYTDHSNVAHDITSIIPNCIRVEINIFLARDVMSWRQLETTNHTYRKNAIVGHLP